MMTRRIKNLLGLTPTFATATWVTASFAQQSCVERLQELAKQREVGAAAVNDLVKSANGQPVDPRAFCSAATGLNVAEEAIIAYMKKNKDKCNFPGELIATLDVGHAKSLAFSDKACAVAQAKKKNSSDSVPVASEGVGCSTNLTVHLTVVLEDEGANMLIELRRGVVGHSTVTNTTTFQGKTGTVSFSNLCAGSYFMDIGNGPIVAVTPVHQYIGRERIESTITITLMNSNIKRLLRKKL